MESKENKSLRLFSEAAKEIMWVTNEVHDDLDNLLEELLKEEASNLQEHIGKTVRDIRAKLCNVNNINMEKLFGVPRPEISYESGVVTKEGT